MKFSLSLALLGLFAFSACEVDEPPRQSTAQRTARYPTQTQSQYPAQPQPFPGDATTQPTPGPAQPMETTTTTTESASAQSAPTTAKGDYPYGVPVPGKPGFVRSPYSPDKMTDVRGYAPGTEVKDPYTNKIFLVP